MEKELKVIGEVIDSSTEFKWRLTRGAESSIWERYYEGVLVHTFKNGETWAYATDYWSGVLPVYTPFQIVVPK
jgi:hypothetical protein